MPDIPYSHPLRVNRLNPRQATDLDLTPDAAERAAIAADLGLIDLPNARLRARITATGADGWALTGQLTARVVQPCGVTLDPVATDIDEPVNRRWSPHLATPDADEAEIPDDDTEPLGQTIDAGEVLTEALSLALPLYPRAPGAALADAGEDTPAAQDTRRPFAGLASLMAGRKGEADGNG